MGMRWPNRTGGRRKRKKILALVRAVEAMANPTARFEARALAASAEDLPGDVVADGDTLWEQLREQTLPWFQSRRHLWRIGIAPADLYDEKWSPVVEWGGAQRWLVGDEDLDVRQGTCAENITLFRATGESERSHPDFDTFQPLTRELFLIHQAIKNSLDPRRIFNRGRVYRNL